LTGVVTIFEERVLLLPLLLTNEGVFSTVRRVGKLMEDIPKIGTTGSIQRYTNH